VLAGQRFAFAVDCVLAIRKSHTNSNCGKIEYNYCDFSLSPSLGMQKQQFRNGSRDELMDFCTAQHHQQKRLTKKCAIRFFASLTDLFDAKHGKSFESAHHLLLLFVIC